jgi:hypothetical protein
MRLSSPNTIFRVPHPDSVHAETPEGKPGPFLCVTLGAPNAIVPENLVDGVGGASAPFFRRRSGIAIAGGSFFGGDDGQLQGVCLIGFEIPWALFSNVPAGRTRRCTSPPPAAPPPKRRTR